MTPFPTAETLEDYAAGRLDPAASVSVELAMARSEEIRMQINAMADPDRLEGNLGAVFAELDAPPRTRTERVLVWLGTPDHVARLLVATPALRRGWFLAVGLALVLALSLTAPANRVATPSDLFGLLLLAPVLPVAGVALAYGPGVDPAYEVTLSTPMNGFRLVLLRSVAVLSVTVFATGLAALLGDQVHWAAAAWLVPSLALSAACLAAMTWVPPRRAGTVVSSAWLVGMLSASNATDDVLLPFEWTGQALFLALGVVSAVVAYRRRDRFEMAVA